MQQQLGMQDSIALVGKCANPIVLSRCVPDHRIQAVHSGFLTPLRSKKPFDMVFWID